MLVFKEVISSLGNYNLNDPELLNVIFRLQPNSYSEKKNDSHFGNKRATELQEKQKTKKQKTSPGKEIQVK